MAEQPRPASLGKGYVVALVDCTSFYAACERLFEPRLIGRPLVVLSNNDGCVVARSKEAKALDIPMGAPAFKLREVFQRHDVVVRSSNYALYADLSRRVMETLSTFSDDVEVYSIDEAFLRLPALRRTDLEALAAEIVDRVERWVGVPVHVGIGRTKVLAKVASEEGSRLPGAAYVTVAGEQEDALLGRTPVQDLWGIGRQHAARLRAQGVETALEFRGVPLPWVRQTMTVVGERLALELRGVACLGVNDLPGPKRSICRSRSFGVPVTDLPTMRRAVATYVSRAAEKVRGHGLVARGVVVFITTKHHGAGPHYSASLAATLESRTAYTPALASAADELVQRIWRSHAPDGRALRYKKAGVLLVDLALERPEQASLFEGFADPTHASLMRAVDAVNSRYGPGACRLATAAPSMGRRSEAWQMQQDYRSPCYTTRWRDLLVVA